MNGFELILPFLRPIQHLILDPDISEIMVNGPEHIFIEKAGYLHAVPDVKLTPESLMVAVKNIARRLGDDISEAKPILDSRLPDGSRVAAVIPPCSIHGVALTIRKFNSHRFKMKDLIDVGSLAAAGTTVKLTTVGAPTPRVSETRVTRADAPELLEYNWGDFNLRWELEASGAGTRLTLWTNIGRPFISMGAAGWHICFDVLDHLLSGTPIGRIAGPEAMKFGGWQRLNAEYAQQFGVETPNWPPKAVRGS